MPETAPRPILWTLDQSSFHGITVHISQLLDSLVITPDIEIIIAGQPERTPFGRMECVSRVLLQHLQHPRQHAAFWFANQEVNVLGHDHIAADGEAIPL